MDCRIIEVDSMKTQNIKKVPYHLVLVVLFISDLCRAQPGFGDAGDNVQDIPVSSIGSYEYSILVIVLIAMFVLFRKRTIKQV